MATFKDKIDTPDEKTVKYLLQIKNHKSKAREFALKEVPVEEFFDEVKRYCESENIDILGFINMIAVESILEYDKLKDKK